MRLRHILIYGKSALTLPSNEKGKVRADLPNESPADSQLWPGSVGCSPIGTIP